MTRRELFALVSGVGAAFVAFPALLRTKVDEKVIATYDDLVEAPRSDERWTAYLFDADGTRLVRTRVCEKTLVYGARWVLVPVYERGSHHYRNAKFQLHSVDSATRAAFYTYVDGPRFWEVAGL